jgi:hypothetical protein
MNIKEAKEQCIQGNKVTHELFADDEFVVCKDGKFMDENGLELPFDEFWNYREKKDYFQEEWELFN